MRVIARAPNRIDLAGGTLDLFPLYLLAGGGLTVNAAVTIESRVEVRTRTDRAVVLRSLDGGEEIFAPSWQQLPEGSALDLLVRAIRFARPALGCEVIAHNQAPRGSGLGASSALMVAACAALGVLTGMPCGTHELVRLAAELEAQVIQVPPGRQDHYAAALGGVNALWFEAGGDRVERLGPDGSLANALDRWMLLCDTGEGHTSAVNNWQILRAYVDGDAAIRRAVEGIRRAATTVHAALTSGPDWEGVAAGLREEWEHRRQLPGVSTPRIERLLAAAAEAGALAGKVCGAGGGGCLFILTPPDRRAEVSRALRQAGGRLLPARIAREGLRLLIDA